MLANFVPQVSMRLSQPARIVKTSPSAMGRTGAQAMAEYADMPWVRAMAAELGVEPADTFFVYVVFAFVFPVAAHAVLTALRVRAEESAGTGELLLAGPTGRTSWPLAHSPAAFAFQA